MGQNVNRPVFPQQMQAQQILIQSSPIQQSQMQQQQQHVMADPAARAYYFHCF